MDSREVFNDVLVHLFNEIMRLEEDVIITEEYSDITNNEMHVIDAVGPEGGNMSAIAAKLRITVGSLTTSMNGLVSKGYAERQRSEEDRRVVNVRLTDKGRKAYEKHREYHMQMIDAMMRTMDEEEIPVLAKALMGLKDFFYQYKKSL
ncbi:MAG: MarR family transcriptional regulator [Clostridium sp.]|nr:MarR family transcriptional regulator [Acetatifactor muris]MCM1528095.1 MarR family transcriptional regulator [Bacteroides sp.]MCM1562122.1 MarR family transcriptional regulator [Clostridium sp.]